jgi:anti-sigma regulatory factor (Ser/Thr protein kinase)
MEMSTQVLTVTESSQAGHARRTAAALATRLGFSEEDAGKVALVTSEAAKNLVAHAREGLLLLRAVHQGPHVGVEVLALDKGPGMADVDLCMRDGYTTAGTGGSGLGAMKRMAAEFDLYSQPGQGTALMARLWSGKPPPPQALEVGVVCVPYPGEEVCGDAWSVADGAPGHERLLVADGLGHGPDAARASRAAVLSFLEQGGQALPQVMRGAHEELRSTRGAAVALVELRRQARQVEFVGVGNISAAVLSPASTQRMVSMNGTLGHQLLKVQPFQYTWSPDALLILCSDGLSTQWRVDRYPGLLARHPALVAGVLLRDFRRGRDDATVLVVRAAAGGGTPS